MIHLRILFQRVAHSTEEGKNPQCQNDRNQTLCLDDKAAQNSSTNCCDQICFRGLCKNTKVGKTETVVHGFMEEYVCTGTMSHTIPPQIVAAVFLALDNGNTALLRLCGSKQLRRFLGLRHSVLIKVCLNVPNDIGEQAAANYDCGKTRQQPRNVALHGKHTESLQPAPQRNEAGNRAVEEPCGCNQIMLSACLPVQKISACNCQKEHINTITKVAFQLHVCGAYDVQKNLQQLTDHDCQTPCSDHCQCHPNAQAKIQHQIWQLE